MNEEQQRLGSGLVVAALVHVVVALLIGVFGYRFVTHPHQILEVTLAGGSGVSQQQVEQQVDNSIVRSLDDIIDKRLKPEQKKVVLKKQEKATQLNPNLAPSFNGSSTNIGNASEEGKADGNGSGAGSGDGFGEGRGVPVTPPRLVSSVRPKYPNSARSQGIEGVVGVKMLVGTDGKVQEAVLVRSSDNAELDKAAIEAVYKWRFSPAKDIFGQKAPCYVTQSIQFDLR